MKKTALLLLMLVGFCGADTVSTQTAQIATAPELSIFAALDIARDYVRERGARLDEQYISSAQLLYDNGRDRRSRYWQIRWSWKMPRLGGDYGLRVYMDRSVVEEIAGP